MSFRLIDGLASAGDALGISPSFGLPLDIAARWPGQRCLCGGIRFQGRCSQFVFASLDFHKHKSLMTGAVILKSAHNSTDKVDNQTKWMQPGHRITCIDKYENTTCHQRIYHFTHYIVSVWIPERSWSTIGQHTCMIGAYCLWQCTRISPCTWEYPCSGPNGENNKTCLFALKLSPTCNTCTFVFVWNQSPQKEKFNTSLV